VSSHHKCWIDIVAGVKAAARGWRGFARPYVSYALTACLVVTGFPLLGSQSLAQGSSLKMQAQEQARQVAMQSPAASLRRCMTFPPVLPTRWLVQIVGTTYEYNGKDLGDMTVSAHS
jgi:hypothetical protein